MIRMFLLDDDPNVIDVLKRIIQQRKLGQVCGVSQSPAEALEDLRYIRPDLVIVDLLMPEMDGVTFVKKARQVLLDVSYIMLSQVSSKDMIASAYDAGVEFFIQKPINSVEVVTVICNVSKKQALQRTMDQMTRLLSTSSVQAVQGEAVGEDRSPEMEKLRRAAAVGMTNLAHMGLDDYYNEDFSEYAGTLYSFEQIRREMDCIQGKTDQHGNVKIKKFLIALLHVSRE